MHSLRRSSVLIQQCLAVGDPFKTGGLGEEKLMLAAAANR
jgi:hypothetical protein